MKNNEIFDYVVSVQTVTCVPKTTFSVTGVLTKSVNEVMTVDLRNKTCINTKKNNPQDPIVLRIETPRFFEMLEISLKAGFTAIGKNIAEKEIKDAFTVVWSRNKQDLKRLEKQESMKV